jgi:hypothetical protein
MKSSKKDLEKKLNAKRGNSPRREEKTILLKSNPLFGFCQSR